MNIVIIAAVVCLLLAATIAFAVKGEKKDIFELLYILVDEAEKLFGSGTGKQKFAYVLEKIYRQLPAIVRLFVTYDTLERWIETALAEMKERWAKKAAE